MTKSRKKRNKVNLHARRYPQTDQDSQILEQHEKAIQEAREAELHERFHRLDPIKYTYEVTTGMAGRWLSTLSREYYKDEGATYNLAEAFLLEMAISEFVFLTNTAEVRESQEYKEWFEEGHSNSASSHMLPRGSHDWTWQGLKSDDTHYYWGDRAPAEAFVSEVQARVAAADCETIRKMRDAEFARFASSDIDFEYHRSRAIWYHCDSSERQSIEGAEKVLQEWDARGRAARLDELATIGKQTDIELQKAREREKELAPEEDSLSWHIQAFLSVEKNCPFEDGIEKKMVCGY